MTIPWTPYVLLFLNLFFFVLVRTPLMSLCLLFLFVFFSAFLFFSLNLYFFLLLFLSVYAGAILILFLFVFMFLSQEFTYSFQSRSPGLVIFTFSILVFTHFLIFLNISTNEYPYAFLGTLPFFFENVVVFYAKNLYFNFGVCFVMLGFIFFTVLVGITDLLDNE